ncbi:BPSL0761 family protein [Paraburkholderia sp. GAS333]|uniref:BPSL0761 family protein n=1 Tax=Paraburkholderia sp. GAS333 TaxID=3156279 RepID=UPI003D26230F
MTTPYERTKAVIETRSFLQMLASDENLTDLNKLREAALRLLRHYPLDVDLAVSAAAFPNVWTAPERSTRK